MGKDILMDLDAPSPAMFQVDASSLFTQPHAVTVCSLTPADSSAVDMFTTSTMPFVATPSAATAPCVPGAQRRTAPGALR